MGWFLGVPGNHGFVYFLVQYGIGLILLAMFLRMILSWFRLDERYAFIRFLAKFTDPFILPIRRLIPPVGMFDIGWIAAFFLLSIVHALLLQSIPEGW